MRALKLPPADHYETRAVASGGTEPEVKDHAILGQTRHALRRIFVAGAFGQFQGKSGRNKRLARTRWFSVRAM